MSEPVIPPLPDPASPPRLVRATLTAAALAGVLLVTVVLPAEYGIDPTRIGRVTGLYRAPETAAEPLPESTGDGASAAAGGGTGSLFKSATPYRSDEMSLTLAPGEGAEIKAQMNAGERLVFSWTSTGGDRSYWTGEFESGGHGAFEAPMTGNHGWFWQNLNDAPVTITVKTSGFYSRLFQP